MSENRTMLCDTAETVFEAAAKAGMEPVEDAGFASLLISEGEGGFGGDWGDAFAILRIAGAKAPALPIGEAIISARFAEVSRPHGAFIRVAQTAGAIDEALRMSIEHSNSRQQFGRPLAKFQAVQQNLAMFAVEAAAVNVAGAAAAAALDKGGDALYEIAAAKLRTNIAIGIATGLAHQAHGAIGFTHEYGLHRFTLSMMQWRSDFGNDLYWAEILGGLAAANGGPGYWAQLTERGDSAQA